VTLVAGGLGWRSIGFSIRTLRLLLAAPERAARGIAYVLRCRTDLNDIDGYSGRGTKETLDRARNAMITPMHISTNPGWSLTTENFAGAISILFTPTDLLAEAARHES
jgi:hypothetical protein